MAVSSPLPFWWLVLAGTSALLAAILLPPPPSTPPPVRATAGFTDWSWERDELEEPLYTVLREPSDEVLEWRVDDDSQVLLELEPEGAEPVRMYVPLSGTLRGSPMDLDRMRGRLTVDLSHFAEGGSLDAPWARILRQGAAAATATVLITDARLGAAPEQIEERLTGTVDLRIEYMGHHSEARLSVEVERIDEDALLVSSVGRTTLPLGGFGPVPARLAEAVGRPLGASLGLEFQVDVRH